MRTERADSAIKGHALSEKTWRNCDGYYAKGQDFRVGCRRLGRRSLWWGNSGAEHASDVDVDHACDGRSRRAYDSSCRHFHTWRARSAWRAGIPRHHAGITLTGNDVEPATRRSSGGGSAEPGKREQAVGNPRSGCEARRDACCRQEEAGQ